VKTVLKTYTEKISHTWFHGCKHHYKTNIDKH